MPEISRFYGLVIYMKRVVEISVSKPFKLLCLFNNGENRVLDLEKVLDRNQKFTKAIFNDNVFTNVKIDSFGGIFWEGIAEIKDLDGTTKPCEYDISPEFVYHNSDPI